MTTAREMQKDKQTICHSPFCEHKIEKLIGLGLDYLGSNLGVAANVASERDTTGNRS